MERNKPEFTSFLNESEISICIEALKDFGITDYCFFGGYENSQRKVLGFFAKEEEYPISIIEYKYRNLLLKKSLYLSSSPFLSYNYLA